MRPIDLRCEHRRDVPCVDDPAPRLSWTLESSERGKRQTAYRIIVSQGDARLWDSGRVESSDTVDIVYAGRALPPASDCWWVVQVWDEAGEPSPWSEPACFRTGLREWRAQWISRDDVDDPGVPVPASDSERAGDVMLSRCRPAPFLRREFAVEGPVRRAMLYATARGLVELHLNGARVGDAVLAPGWTDYRKRIEYAAHDVTELLADGTNVLSAILGDGWYSGFVGFDLKRAGARYGTYPELLCELHVEYEDGTLDVVASDERWRATTGPIRYSDLLHGEHYDARRELDDWRAVRTRERDGVALVPERAQPIRVTEELQPVSVTEREPGVHVVDFGQNMVGWVRMEVEGERGTTVRLRFAEMLEEDGSLHVANLRTARPQETYVLRGGGARGLRAAVHVPRVPLRRGAGAGGGAGARRPRRALGHAVRPVGSSARATSSTSCGATSPGASAATSCRFRPTARSATSGSAGWPTRRSSCPAPRSTWTSPPSSPSGATTSSTRSRPTARTRTSLPGSGRSVTARPRGATPGSSCRGRSTSATATCGSSSATGTRWSATWRTWSATTRTCCGARAATTTTATGCPSARTRRARCSRPRTWPTTRSSWRASPACWDEADREAHYEELFRDVVAAFNRAYVGEDGFIEGDTQTVYLLALHMDLVPDELRERVAERLVADIEARDWHLTTGFIGVGLLCPVLTEAGYADVAYRLLLNETFPSWGYSIRHGATTIWERWDGWTEERGFQTPLMNSFNHYSLGSVAQWLYEYVAGIRLDPERPGYEHVLIAPEPGGLEWARATYHSVRGPITQRVAPGGRHLPARRRDPGERDGHGRPARRREARGRLRAPELHHRAGVRARARSRAPGRGALSASGCRAWRTRGRGGTRRSWCSA